MRPGAPAAFGAQLKALRLAAGFTQEELATIAGLSVHAVSALERGHRRRPHVETVRALSAALDLTDATRDALVESARGRAPGCSAACPCSRLRPLAVASYSRVGCGRGWGVAVAAGAPRRPRGACHAGGGGGGGGDESWGVGAGVGGGRSRLNS